MIKTRVTGNFRPLSAVCRAILAQIKALPIINVFYSRCFIGLVENRSYYARASDAYFERPEVEILDEPKHTPYIINPVWQIEGVSMTMDEDTAVKDV